MVKWKVCNFVEIIVMRERERERERENNIHYSYELLKWVSLEYFLV
jgi:hypothetical protein